MRTIIAVIIGLTFVSCSEEPSKPEELNESINREVQVKPVVVNEFLGCWEDISDSLPVYWCFDSSEVNRSGYIHSYSFSGDSLKISELEFSFEISDSTLRMVDRRDSTKTSLKRSQLTESPNVF